MKVLIDIGHPAHVHLFKNLALIMLNKGHEIFFTCRDKEYELYLLERYGFKYKCFGKKFNSRTGKLFGLLKFNLMEVIEGLYFTPDIFLSHGSVYAAHASFILRKPHISLEDTFNFEQIRLYEPFTKVILTSDYNHPLKSKKVIRYSGYHELAYLHPNYFTPDIDISKELGLKSNEKFVILRFVSWTATHDTGHKGISLTNKIMAVKEFSKYARVFISSEKELPKELHNYQLNIKPERIHDALAFSSLVFGESATMAAESAVLGIPSIYLDNTGRYYTRELEHKYGLVFNYTESEEDQKKAIIKAVEIISKPNDLDLWQKKRNKLLNEKIDVTAYLINFIENYPEILKEINAESTEQIS